jgi:hypothetical protein
MTPIDDENGSAVTPPEDHPHHDLADGPEDVLPARTPGRRAKPPVEGTPSPLGRIVLPLALAVVAAVAVFAAWGHLQSDDTTDLASSPSATPTVSVTSSPAPTESPSTTPSSAEPTPSTSVTPTESATESPTTSASPSESATSVVIDRSVPVTILNGTRRTGLAAKVAADLKKLGWTVVSIGNWRAGGVETTTVFVQGRADAAATMRRDLEAADATKTPIGSMRTNRITIVVMDDYPKS